MTHADQPRDGQSQDQPRQRGASTSAIAGALQRTPHPGPQHWGGPRPRRKPPEPFFSVGPVPPPQPHDP
ncbi:calcium-binding protein [Nocardiopsis aegyptia]|uniref:Uncharacterized protein n=1 Tax=Nocardiopsis aegyptia TaxID=220378 RepID=A0A7Z0EQ07_9ACTN|nr:calcium-binding protein [Nocardiopsis aegyptia]NYJ36140.1 hypothetical protein [Nocardiopsis aegyptia]